MAKDYYTSVAELKKELAKAKLTLVDGEVKKDSDLIHISRTKAISKAFDALTETKKEDIVKYGYDFIDQKLLGIFKGDLVVVGSETGGGKTTFVNHVAASSAQQGKKVAFFLLEDNPVDIALNDMYFEINRIREKEGKPAFPYEAYRTNDIKDIHEWYARAYDNLKYDNVEYIKRADGQIMTEKEVIEKIKEIKDQYDLIIIDHLHYIKFNSGRNLQEEIEAFMRNLSATTISTGVRVILVAHYRKLGGQKPTDESFKDAQAIPQNATTTIHIWRDRKVDDEEVGSDETENYNEMKKYQTEFYIQKSRMPFGTGSIKAQFNPTTNDYYNHSEWNPGSTPLTKEEVQDNLITF